MLQRVMKKNIKRTKKNAYKRVFRYHRISSFLAHSRPPPPHVFLLFCSFAFPSFFISRRLSAGSSCQGQMSPSPDRGGAGVYDDASLEELLLPPSPPPFPYAPRNVDIHAFGGGISDCGRKREKTRSIYTHLPRGYTPLSCLVAGKG